MYILNTFHLMCKTFSKNYKMQKITKPITNKKKGGHFTVSSNSMKLTEHRLTLDIKRHIVFTKGIYIYTLVNDN